MKFFFWIYNKWVNEFHSNHDLKRFQNAFCYGNDKDDGSHCSNIKIIFFGAVTKRGMQE